MSLNDLFHKCFAITGSLSRNQLIQFYESLLKIVSCTDVSLFNVLETNGRNVWASRRGFGEMGTDDIRNDFPYFHKLMISSVNVWRESRARGRRIESNTIRTDICRDLAYDDVGGIEAPRRAGVSASTKVRQLIRSTIIGVVHMRFDLMAVNGVILKGFPKSARCLNKCRIIISSPSSGAHPNAVICEDDASVLCRFCF